MEVPLEFVPLWSRHLSIFFRFMTKNKDFKEWSTNFCTEVRESVVVDGNWDACSHLLLLYLFLALLFGYCPLNQIKYYPSSSSFWTQTKGSLLWWQQYDSLFLLIPLNFVSNPQHYTYCTVKVGEFACLVALCNKIGMYLQRLIIQVEGS